MSASSGDPTDPGTRREIIVDIAASCFARQGFHGVSMRDIAQEYGSSVATLYNHFPSKEALMLAIGERFYTALIRDLATAAADGRKGLERLVAMAGITYAHGLHRRSEFLTIAHDTRLIALTKTLTPLVGWRNECVRLWSKVLREGADDGSIQSGLDPGAVIWILFGAITGILEDAQSAAYAEKVTGDPIATLRAVFSDGLRPRD